MVLGKFFKSASLGRSPDIPVLPAVQGSSCVFVSGCAGAILGLSFLAASRAGVFHGTRELPGAASRLLLHTCVGAVWRCQTCSFYFSIFPFPLQEKTEPSVRQIHSFLPVLIEEGERLTFVFLIWKVEHLVNPLWKRLPGRLDNI